MQKYRTDGFGRTIDPTDIATYGGAINVTFGK